MRLPSARQLWRSTVRAVLNPGWKQRALRSRHLNQAITRFQHRAIHRDLTADTLGGISDDEILQAGTFTLPYPAYSSKTVDGVPLFDVQDNDRPLSDGAIALVIEEGRMATEAVTVGPAIE